MKTLTQLFSLLVIASLVALGGCSDPTEGKDQAEVSEAIDIPQEAAPAEETTEAPSEEMAAEEPAGDATLYVFDEYAYIGFTGSKPLGKHSGQFPDFEGSVSVTGDDITTGKIKIVFETGTLIADDTRLAETLKGESFFESEEFPTATFESASIGADGDSYKVTGNLTIRGTTKGVSFPADIAIDGNELTATAEFTINRKAWGIAEGYISDTVINEDVIIELDILAVAGA